MCGWEWTVWGVDIGLSCVVEMEGPVSVVLSLVNRTGPSLL